MGQKTPFFLNFERIFLGIGIKPKFLNENNFQSKLSAKKSVDIIITIDTNYNTSSQVNKWIWNRLRLNEERIGKELAGLPVLVLGIDKKFIEKPEGKVFRDFKWCHQYLTKPLNLQKFLEALSILSPIDPGSLSVIKEDAPESMLGVLEHDLKAISQKFNYNGSDENVRKRFHEVKIDLKNYETLEKDKKKARRIKEEIEKLKTEIIKRKGNIWK